MALFDLRKGSVDSAKDVGKTYTYALPGEFCSSLNKKAITVNFVAISAYISVYFNDIMKISVRKKGKVCRFWL